MIPRLAGLLDAPATSAGGRTIAAAGPYSCPPSRAPPERALGGFFQCGTFNIASHLRRIIDRFKETKAMKALVVAILGAAALALTLTATPVEARHGYGHGYGHGHHGRHLGWYRGHHYGWRHHHHRHRY